MADAKQAGEAREFAGTIVDLADANLEAGKLLQQLIAAVRDTGKPGTMTLKLSVKLLPGSDKALVVTPAVTATLPKRDVKAGVFFADKDNNPQRSDPDQPGLFAEEEIRTAARAAGADLASGEVKSVE
jgi:hypothetical protein